jgi:uncharacterized protein YfiM (DUF2279 family)
MNNRNFFALLMAILFFNLNALAAEGEDSTQINKKRLNTVIIGSGVVYSASLVALNNAWYKKERTTFHFFNDNNGWNQVDKCGHFYSAYQLSRISSALFLWTNMSEKKSALWGTVMSQAFMTTIDVFDGFSLEYGFSWGDIAANMMGAGLFLSQELIFREQKIKLKLSFHRSDYAELNPELLGQGYPEENLKDYNGQTYWLSFDIYAIAGSNPKIPKWINLAFGYGAEGMVYEKETDNLANGFESYRQYYLGIDFDLSHIKTKSKFVNTLFFVLDMVKLPAPAIEWNKKGTKYHWLNF